MTSTHSPQHLLRASDFCRPRNPPKRRVKIHLVLNDEIPIESVHSQDVSACVYASVNMMIALSVKQGDVAWLQPENLRGVAVLVMADDQRERTPEDHDMIRIPPTVAASMGFCYPYSSKETYGFIQAYTYPIPKVRSVTVRPLGRPVSKRTTGSRESASSCVSAYPPLDSDCRLLTRSGIIAAIDSCKGGLYVFDVSDITLRSDADRHSSVGDVYYTTRQTEWKLEPFPAGESIPRLPALSKIRNFLSLTSNVRPVHASPPPHPSVEQLRQAMLLPGPAPPSQSILHVVGTEENHVGVCIGAAADQLGMRYLAIHGLAAFVHSSGQHVVSTGGLPDQLAGCQQALQMAKMFKPCVLHLCDFDRELSGDDEQMRHMEEQRFLTAIDDALSSLNSCGDDTTSSPLSSVPAVIVVLSTTQSLPTGPLRHNLVFPSVKMQSPNKEYSSFLWNNEPSFDAASQLLAGRSARDTVLLHRHWQSSHDLLEVERLCKSIDSTQKTLTARIPNVHWQDVGGLAHVRNEILDAIELPLRHAHLFPSSLGGRTGILLYGPPGTGKTLVAKAVATECGLPFLSVKGPELLGSYVGESEANVRAIFAAARDAATRGPSNGDQRAAAVLFFDELDSLAPRRGGVGDGGGVMERVVATLLTELDGRQSSEGEMSIVFAIGATNRPDLLDPALLRPGRLDRLVYLGMAATAEDRAQILAASIRKFRLNPPDPLGIARSVVDQLPTNLSGADFAAIASGALRKSLDRLCRKAEAELQQSQEKTDLDTILDQWEDEQLAAIVTPADLLDAAKDVTPSIRSDQLADYEQLQSQFNNG